MGHTKLEIISKLFKLFHWYSLASNIIIMLLIMTHEYIFYLITST